MPNRKQVLDSLCEAVEARQTEGVASTLGALAVGSALVAKALAAKPAPPSHAYAAIPLARKLTAADDRLDELEAVAGLLGVCARALQRLNDQSDIGHRVRHLAEVLRTRIGR